MSYAGPARRAARASEAPTAKSTDASRVRRGSAPPARRSANHESGQMLGFAAGIALGIVVGAGAALLFAPQTGSDTRRGLARRARRLRDRGEDAWDGLRREFRRARRRRALAKAADPEGSE